MSSPWSAISEHLTPQQRGGEDEFVRLRLLRRRRGRDARQSFAADRTEYGVLVLDAFSSDAIPMHLVTREAEHLPGAACAGGVLAFHVSNRHLTLEPVLARLAQEAALVSMIRLDRSEPGSETGKTGSEWMVIARRSEDLGAIAFNDFWTPSRSKSCRRRLDGQFLEHPDSTASLTLPASTMCLGTVGC